MSKEGMVFRVVAAVAVGGALLGCARPGRRVEVIPTPTPTSTPTPESLAPPLPCGEEEFYPGEGVPIPLEGRYLIEPPVGYGQFCEILLVEHENLIAVLRIGNFVELLVEAPDIPAPFLMQVFASDPPREGKDLAFSFKGLSFRMSLTEDGNYLVEYESVIY